MAVKVTKELIAQEAATIDWAAIDALTDADIERQVEANPDAAPISSTEAAKRAWNDTSKPAATRIRLVREALRLSRPEFARAYGLSLRTLEGWEQGLRQPDPNAQALLAVIAHLPERTREILERRADQAA